MNSIAERLKHVRMSIPMSQTALANKLAITSAHISKIESGKTIPSDSLIKLICKEFMISEEWLKHGTGIQSIRHLENATEEIMMEATRKLNVLLRTDDVYIRAHTAQLNEYFTNIINIEGISPEKVLGVLTCTEKLFFDLSSIIKLGQEYTQGKSVHTKEEIFAILERRTTIIDSNLDCLMKFYTSE